MSAQRRLRRLLAIALVALASACAVGTPQVAVATAPITVEAQP